MLYNCKQSAFSRGLALFLRIEKGSAVPISRQIAQQIATLCAAGSLASGDRLPSVRELARDLGVNQNTILRVYERLCRDGLLEMRHGQGTFVALAAKANASPGQRDRLVEELRQIAQQALSLGLSKDEVFELVAIALDQLLNPPPSKGGARGGMTAPDIHSFDTHIVESSS